MNDKQPTISLVLPAYNEEAIIIASLQKVSAVCAALLGSDWSIIVVDNGSTDKTGSLVKTAMLTMPRVHLVQVEEPGKGSAIVAGWLSATSDAYLFSDVDLSVDLERVLPRVLEAFSRGATVVIGSRFLAESEVERSILRRFVSDIYRRIARALLDTKLTDLPCGFKGVSREARDRLLPKVNNTKWFFDSELVLIAEATHEQIVEVPVVWKERDTDVSLSRLPLLKTSWQYLRELWLLRRRLHKK